MNPNLDSITTKLNDITRKLAKNVELSDEMLVNSEELHDYITDIEPTTVITEYSTNESFMTAMFSDFERVRALLIEQTDNVKNILNSVTTALSFDNTNDKLLTAFAELNRAQLDCMKLFMETYRTTTNIFCTIERAKQLKAQNAISQQSIKQTAELKNESAETLQTILARIK